MEKELTRGEAMAIAERLKLTSYINTVKLVESLHIENNKELNVCVFTTDKRCAESIFADLTGSNIRLGYDTMLNAEIRYGSPAYEVVTEYGELSVDEAQFCEVVAHKNIECNVATDNEVLKNLRLTLLYTPEYGSIGEDTWRCILFEADKAIMGINANQILNQTEQKFVKRLLLPLYSPSRLLYAIGNAQYVRPEEWTESVDRVHRIAGQAFTVFPIFPENVPEEVRASFDGSDVTLNTVLNYTAKNIIEVRKRHVDDLDNYCADVLENALIELRHKLENLRHVGSEAVSAAELDIEKLSLSRTHIEKYINLFLQTPLLARYRDDVEQFASLLTASLKEDIMQSSDIKKDAKALPRYLSFVWDSFTEEQNSELSRLFEKETATFVDMMNLDLKKITRDINHIELSADLKKHLEGAFSVHTFFARKTTAGNGLTEAMTIGGMIATMFAPPIGVGAIIGSELIKVFGKGKFDNEYKEELVAKIGSVVERNMKELIAQAEANFKNVADAYRGEILAYYDETIAKVKEYLSKEKSEVIQAHEAIEYIDSLI